MRHWFTFSILVLSMFANGCADDGSSLFIIRNLEPDSECIVATGNATRTSGLMDVARIPAGRGYTMYPLVGAQLVDRANGTDVNPFDVTVVAMDVRLEDEAGNTLPLGGLANPFRVPTNTFIEAFSGMGTIPTGIAAVEAIPPAYVAQIANDGIGRVSVALRPIGITTGGIDIEGAFHYNYVIETCVNCTAGCFLPDGEASFSCNTGQDSVDLLGECP